MNVTIYGKEHEKSDSISTSQSSCFALPRTHTDTHSLSSDLLGLRGDAEEKRPSRDRCTVQSSNVK